MSNKEITPKPISVKALPPKPGLKEITPDQGNLDLGVERQKEIQGVGMGVLTDGTAFLTQRGLARLCGIQNAHIGTIDAEWNEPVQKPRITKIKEMLASRGVAVEMPHIKAHDRGNAVYAYPDVVSLAILEYYAFEAGPNNKEEARKNFRILAGKALHDFIYAQVGYDPNNALPEAWRQFHDRVSLAYNTVPVGYFSVFKEIADMIVTLGQGGLHITASFVPDISVGVAWSKFWLEKYHATTFGERQKYPHNYPSYFPQALSNPQAAWCYPEAALGEFRRWFRQHYIGDGQFTRYLSGKVRALELPASFVQLAITAYSEKS